MKVLIGVFEKDHGMVEASPSGLIYAGPDPERVREIVEHLREWYDHSGILHVLGDEELVRSLPYRRQGWTWALFVDEATGLTLDPPGYDPWGRIWRSV